MRPYLSLSLHVPTLISTIYLRYHYYYFWHRIGWILAEELDLWDIASPNKLIDLWKWKAVDFMASRENWLKLVDPNYICRFLAKGYIWFEILLVETIRRLSNLVFRLGCLTAFCGGAHPWIESLLRRIQGWMNERQGGEMVLALEKKALLSIKSSYHVMIRFLLRIKFCGIVQSSIRRSTL